MNRKLPLLLSVFGFSYATAVDTNGATPGLGLIERLGQYLYQLWQATLAALLVRRSRGADSRRMGV